MNIVVTVAALICTGRPINDHGHPIGNPCGRQFAGPEVVNDGRGRPREATTADIREHARAAGWSTAGPPMCPACRRPDPAIARNLTRKDQP